MEREKIQDGPRTLASASAAFPSTAAGFPVSGQVTAGSAGERMVGRLNQDCD